MKIGAITQLVCLVFAAAALLITSGCGEESGKGPESQMPVDGSADSFFAPTQHGALMFGSANQAELTAEAGYHTWTFTLSATSQVRLEVSTQVANFDTVMYLYKDKGAGNWGSYLHKNDDFEDNVWSSMDKELAEGDYKVMIKGYKEKIRGSFALAATCTGDGCPGAGNNDCDPKHKDKGEYGLGEACLDLTLALLSTDVGDENGFFVTESGLCQSPEHVRRAWHFYYDYMVEYYDDYWAEEREEEDSNFGFDVEVTQFGDAGWIVGVDCGGDESAMSMLYDSEYNLIMYYQHNQSPIAEWSCLEPGEKDLGWESEWCTWDFLRNYRGAPAGLVAETGTVAANAAVGNLPDGVAAAVLEYKERESLADDTVVSYTYTTWNGGDDAILYQVDLSATDKNDVSYTLGVASKWDAYIYVTETGSGKDFPCSSIDVDFE